MILPDPKIVHDHMLELASYFEGKPARARFWLIHCQDAFAVIRHMMRVLNQHCGMDGMPFDAVYDRTITGELTFLVGDYPLIVSPHAMLGRPTLFQEA